MQKVMLCVVVCAILTGKAVAQDYVGPTSVGAQEPLFPFDDPEPWKHGYRQVMPYYGGWHSFRPYNYHHVFGQTQAANAWGYSMPYSQQFWHRYQMIPGEAVGPLPAVMPPPYSPLNGGIPDPPPMMGGHTSAMPAPSNRREPTPAVSSY